MSATQFKMTKHDKVFALFAPTLLLVAAYCWFVARPLSAEIASLRQRRAALGAPEEIMAARPALEARLADAGKRLEAAVAASAEAQRAIVAEAGGRTSVSAAEPRQPHVAEAGGRTSVSAAAREPAERLRALGDVFRGHGGRVVSCALADEKAAAPRVLPAWIELFRRIADANPRLWDFEVEAGYADMAAALAALADGRECLVDSLEMKPAEAAGAPCSWRLSIWM